MGNRGARGAAGFAVLLVVSAAGPGAARAQTTCTFDAGSVTWAAISDGTHNDCATPGATDSFVVPSGSVVTITGDILYAGTANSGGATITVEDGGTLICRVEDGCREIALDRWLVCEAGSTCRFNGRYLTLGVASPFWVDILPAPGGAFPAGQVVPCAGWDASDSAWEPDCDGGLTDPGDLTGSRVRAALVYPLADYASPQPLPGEIPDLDTPGLTLAELTATLDAIGPGDVIFWHDPDLETAAAPVDENFAYIVTHAAGDYAGAGTQGALAFDVRQTDLNAPRIDSGGYPDLLKELDSALIGSAVAAGTGNSGTLIEAPAALLPGTTAWSGTNVAPREERVGMFLRFDCAGDGTPCDEVFPIVRVWNDMPDDSAIENCSGGSGTCDMLDLYTPDGFPYALPANTRFWIDHGWKKGDPFGVMQMVHIHNAGAVQASTKTRESFRMSFRAEDASTLRATIVEDTRVDLGDFPADPDGCDGTNTVIEDVWIRDPYYGAQSTTVMTLNGCRDLVLRRIQKTGGSETLAHANHHGVTWGTQGAAGTIQRVSFMSFGWRHAGDDWISGGGDLVIPSRDLLLWRARFQWASSYSVSQNFTSVNNHAVELRVVDGECIQCASPDTYLLEEHQVEGFLAIGGGASIASNFAGTIEDLTALGDGVHTLSENVNHFVLAQGASWRSVGGVTAIFDASIVREARNGIVRDYGSTRNSLIGSLDDGVLSNLLLLDVYRVLGAGGLPTTRPDCDVSVCNSIRVNEPSSFTSFERITHAFRDGSSTGRDFFFETNHSTPGRQRIDGLLFHGTSSGGGLMRSHGGNVPEVEQMALDTVAGPCIGLGVSPGDPTTESLLPSTTVQGLDLELSDPADDVYTATSGGIADLARCGIYGGRISPGIHRMRPYHHWLGGVAPENAGRTGAQFEMPSPSWEITVSGIAAGGSIAFAIEGLTLIVSTTAGISADLVAELIAAEINANGVLASFGIQAERFGAALYFEGAVTSLTTDDPGLSLSSAPGGPKPKSLPALSAPIALAVAFLCTAVGLARTIRPRDHRRQNP